MTDSTMSAMKWRAIIQFSLDRDIDSHRSIRLALTKIGFVKSGTGKWEATAASPYEVKDAINVILDNLKAEPEVLDHLLIYIDRAGD